MTKKNRRLREEAREREGGPISRPLLVAGGGVIIALFAGLAILIVTLLGGASLSEDDGPKVELEPIPTLTAEMPEFERSAAADLLEGKSFDDMTPEELALVKSEAERVYADAELRVSSRIVPALDIVRRDGRTRISRQYAYNPSPGGDLVLLVTVGFYCDSDIAGFVDVYRSRTQLGTTNVEGDRIAAGAQAFDSVLSATDWADAKDLGYEEVGGRRTHHLEVQRTLQSGSKLAWQLWIDVETAQLLRSVDGTAPDAPYTFDWHRPETITPVPELGTPPCYAAIYGA